MTNKQNHKNLPCHIYTFSYGINLNYIFLAVCYFFFMLYYVQNITPIFLKIYSSNSEIAAFNSLVNCMYIVHHISQNLFHQANTWKTSCPLKIRNFLKENKVKVWEISVYNDFLRFVSDRRLQYLWINGKLLFWRIFLNSALFILHDRKVNSCVLFLQNAPQFTKLPPSKILFEMYTCSLIKSLQ